MYGPRTIRGRVAGFVAKGTLTNKEDCTNQTYTWTDTSSCSNSSFDIEAACIRAELAPTVMASEAMVPTTTMMHVVVRRATAAHLSATKHAYVMLQTFGRLPT